LWTPVTKTWLDDVSTVCQKCLKNTVTLLEPNQEKLVSPPLFSGEASEAFGGLLATKNPRDGPLGSEDPVVLPGGSPEVGQLPPEVGRSPLMVSCTMAVTRTTIRIEDGNISHLLLR
jgi:hypothetical protein